MQRTHIRRSPGGRGRLGRGNGPVFGWDARVSEMVVDSGPWGPWDGDVVHLGEFGEKERAVQ